MIGSAGTYLEELSEGKQTSRARAGGEYASHKAPRYRPILGRISEDTLNVDPNISDKELEMLLHKQLSEIEGSLLSEGHEVMNFGVDESPAQYRARLANYLAKVDDIKKSDLANYVFHRKVILDILQKAIQRGGDGKYAREELIHELIMPMRQTSNEIRLDSCNLWLIDERLAFHDFLASDKPLSTMPITDCQDTKEPDICALNVFDEPILMADGQTLPLASIVVVEILGDHLKSGHLLSVQNRPLCVEPDVIVLPCRSQSGQDAYVVRRGKVETLRRGRALRSDPGPITRGWLRKNRRSRPSAVWLAGRLSEGFVFFASIPKVRLRRGRPLDPRLRRRRAFFARHPYCFCSFHWLTSGCWFWFASFAGRTGAHVRDAASDRAWR